VKRNLLRFFLSLIVVTVICTALWIYAVQVPYTTMFAPLARPLFRLLDVKVSGAVFVMEHFASLIPFLALSISLPHIPLKRRLSRMAIGLGSIVFIHFLLIIISSVIFTHSGLSARSYKQVFPMLLVNDALPLILWFVLFSEEVIRLFSRRKASVA
jgi:hypothetical protein